jgi:hypothetical protein
MESMARKERFLWFSVLPTGPLFILSGLWLAARYGALPPEVPGMVDWWAKYSAIYWVGTAVSAGAAWWIRANLFTPESLNRMNLVTAPNVGRLRNVQPPAGLDEGGLRRWTLWQKHIARNFLLLGVADAPVMVMIGIYVAVHIAWFPPFAALYSIGAAWLFRPSTPKDTITAAAQLLEVYGTGARS